MPDNPAAPAPAAIDLARQPIDRLDSAAGLALVEHCRADLARTGLTQLPGFLRPEAVAASSRAPIAKLEAYRKRLGWTLPWVSSFGTDFNPDFGVGPEVPRPDAHQDGEMFGLSVFLRDGDAVFRTYFTQHRGVEALGSVWTLLDLTPLGRQEEWEDAPEGTPQSPPYAWWCRHDEYGDDPARGRR